MKAFGFDIHALANVAVDANDSAGRVTSSLVLLIESESVVTTQCREDSGELRL